ncbi:MAG: hypothetical protein WAK96_10860 [Desulfobaccales bacterium]
MFKNIKNKLLVWGQILLWPIVKIVGTVTTIHVIDWLLELFAPIWREKWGIKMIMSLFSWQIWTIISLIGLLILTLESAYRLISKKEEALAQLRKEQDMMSLKEACDRLNKSVGMKIELFDTYKLYNKLAKLFVEVDDIYGKSPSLEFTDWRVINKNKLISGAIVIEQGELVLYTPGGIYPDDILEYIGLAIKKDRLKEDIDKIMSEMD